MKYPVIFFAFLLYIATGAIAQDTIYSTQPKDNYFAPFWPDSLGKKDNLCNSGLTFRESKDWWSGIGLYTSDSIKIKGLAFCMGSQGHFSPDTMFKYAYLTLQTIDQTPTGKHVVGEDLIIHGDQAPAYYWEQGLTFLYPAGINPYPPRPMYELYYEHPITVYDSFMIGGWEYIPADTGTNLYGQPCYYHLSNEFVIEALMLYGETFSNTPDWVYFTPQGTAMDGWETLPGKWWYINEGDVYMFFPILSSPSDDSTQTTVQTAPWERYVSLQPNPATDKATVLSSFGLTEVEVIDIAGNHVLRQEASGLSAKLDVSALPRGTYIVRIHTPLGTATRRLLVQ